MADTPVRDRDGRLKAGAETNPVSAWRRGAIAKLETSLRNVQASLGLRPDLVPDFAASVNGHVFLAWRRR